MSGCIGRRGARLSAAVFCVSLGCGGEDAGAASADAGNSDASASATGQDRGGIARVAANAGPMLTSGRGGGGGAGESAAGSNPGAARAGNSASQGPVPTSGSKPKPMTPMTDAAGRKAQPAATDEDAGTMPASDGGSMQDRPAANGGMPSTSEGCVPFVMPSDCTTPDGRPLPTQLRCTGLYGDWSRKALACGVSAYRPAYELWSDGAAKQRWFSLPQGGHIDAARPEAFVYPIGTQFWKEFRVQVNGEQKLAETRLLRKVSDARNGWVYTSYVWDERGQDALQTNDGASNVLGSDHVVPNLDQCRQCHAGREDFVLGWDPVLLGAGAQGVTLEQLTASGVLQNAPAAPVLPGTDSQALALAYLHANCGVSCHNPNGDAKDSGLFMRLDLDALQSVDTTSTLVTGLRKAPWENAKIQTLMPPADTAFVDLLPGRADASLILVRMQTRGSEAQMPPIASLHVDESGLAQVRALIQ
jgi:hypothetical protein